MSILHKDRILALLKKPIDDPAALRITPLLDGEAQIKEDAVDIRLGCYFLVPRSEKGDAFVPGTTRGEQVAYRLHVPPGRTVTIPGKGVVLASAYEYIKMPGHIAGQVLTRSSIGRIFVTTATANLVHAYYRGCLTLEIVNHGNSPLQLDTLSRIAQLQFHDIGEEKALDRDKVSGRYTAAIEPEFPDFDADMTELKKLRSFSSGLGKEAPSIS